MKLLKLLFLLILSIPASAQIQLGADIDGEAADDYSSSVSLSSDGTTLAIGAQGNDGTGADAGHVRVYEYSAGSWSQLGSDIDGEAASDYSGTSVSLSSDGTTVAIGATGNDGTGADAGHVRVYEYSAGSWTQLGADIDGEAADDQSGYSVSLSSDGTTVAIGARWNDGNGTYAGHVRIYEYSAGSWSQLGADIDGEAANNYSGISVSLSSDGTTVAIGATGNDGNGASAGHVKIYEYSSGSWTQLGSDIDGEAADDQSGWSLSLSSDGTTVAIGARGNDGNGTSAGHVRIYEYSAGSWSQLGADIDGEAADDESGWSVSLSSESTITGRTIVAIGARWNDGTGTNAGHVRVYSFCLDTIQQQPQSNTFYTIPGEAYFSVNHSDTSATYQWQQNNGTGWSNLSEFGIYSGTTTDSVALSGINSLLNNSGFRCLIVSCNNIDTTDIAILTVVNNVGIEEVVKDIVVSPNPTSGLLNIVLTSLSEYEVYNINGQIVAKGKTEGQIDITNLPTGSYQLIITNEDGRSVHTIQKI